MDSGIHQEHLFKHHSSAGADSRKTIERVNCLVQMVSSELSLLL